MGRDRRPPAHPEWGRHLRRESRRTDVAVGRQPSHHAGAAVEILVRPGHAQAQGDGLDQGEIRRSSGAPMTDYREADVSRLKTVPIAQRPNKVDPSLLAHPPGTDRSFTAFWDSLPDILAAKDLRTVARQLVQATGRRGIVAMLGGHVIKVGLGPLLRELIRRGVITHLALNGSAAIHDFELAAYGGTSEDVAAGLADGTFGMAEETGREMNTAITEGARAGKGMGEALVDYLARRPRLARSQSCSPPASGPSPSRCTPRSAPTSSISIPRRTGPRSAPRPTATSSDSPRRSPRSTTAASCSP